MQARLENWINGLDGDWCVSRQRFFGVPFPVWYRVREDGTRRSTTRRSCRPKTGCRSIRPPTCPRAIAADQRDQPGGFSGDPDVMDTWATSSLTPQIAGGWVEDPDLFARVFPMDVRPQAHDIIRTWLFSTVLRAQLEHGSLPWTNAAISGWVLDPDRKKMSKSKGNVVTPMGLLEEHGSDGVRYWAASGRPGTDTAFDPAQMKVGRRLAIKLLNASKFVLVHGRSRRAGRLISLDRGLLTSLAQLVRRVDAGARGYDYARVLERTETFFWSFCDDYLELVKARRYGDHGAEAAGSANARCSCVLSVLCGCSRRSCRSSTEEVWSWWQPGSVHAAAWPTRRPKSTALTAGDADARSVRARARRSRCSVRSGEKKSVEQAAAQGDDRGRRASSCATARRFALLQAGRGGPARRLPASSSSSTRVGERLSRGRRASHAGGRCRSARVHEDASRSTPLDPGALPRDRPPRARGRSRLGRRHDRGHRRRRSSAPAASFSPSRRACSPASTWRPKRSGSSIPRCASRCTGRTAIAARRATWSPNVRGSAAPMLTAERTALNFLQRLSGIATLTRRFVDAAGGRITVLDTRKTTPTLRALEKYAVRAGGGTNHRAGLDDGILIKDNHIRLAGGVAEAVRADEGGAARRCRSRSRRRASTRSTRRSRRARTSSCSTTCRPTRSRRPWRRIAGRAKTEISGGVTLDRMPELAQTGADYVSVGALTHSAPAVDLSFEIEPDPASPRPESRDA